MIRKGRSGISLGCPCASGPLWVPRGREKDVLRIMPGRGDKPEQVPPPTQLLPLKLSQFQKGDWLEVLKV